MKASKLLGIGLALAASLAVAGPANAAFTLNFEGIEPYPPGNGNPVFVSLFYAGGSSTIGTVGTNYGATFANGGLARCLNSLTVTCGNASRGGLGDPNSQKGALQFDVENGYINVAGGFGTAVSFYYSALGAGGYSADVFDDLNGTGNLLGTASLALTQGSCAAYNASFCPFQLAAVTFAGTAKSVRFNSPKFVIVLDDVSFGNVPVNAVPEPSTWAMLIAGFGLIGRAMRDRRRAQISGRSVQSRN